MTKYDNLCYYVILRVDKKYNRRVMEGHRLWPRHAMLCCSSIALQSCQTHNWFMQRYSSNWFTVQSEVHLVETSGFMIHFLVLGSKQCVGLHGLVTCKWPGLIFDWSNCLREGGLPTHNKYIEKVKGNTKKVARSDISLKTMCRSLNMFPILLTW